MPSLRRRGTRLAAFATRWLQRGTQVSGLAFRTVAAMPSATSSAVTGLTPRAAGTPADSSVSTTVGRTMLTSIPDGASSARVASEKPTTANFDAEYVAPFGTATRPTAEATL